MSLNLSFPPPLQARWVLCQPAQQTGRTKKIKMRKTNPGQPWKVPGERLGRRGNSRSLYLMMSREAILYRTPASDAESLEPTTVGLKWQAHPPHPQSQSVTGP